MSEIVHHYAIEVITESGIRLYEACGPSLEKAIELAKMQGYEPVREVES